MSQIQQNKNLNKLIIVAALGYFVDIYDLLLFGVERTDSLNTILPLQFPHISEATLKILNATISPIKIKTDKSMMIIRRRIGGISLNIFRIPFTCFGVFIFYSIQKSQ